MTNIIHKDNVWVGVINAQSGTFKESIQKTIKQSLAQLGDYSNLGLTTLVNLSGGWAGNSEYSITYKFVNSWIIEYTVVMLNGFYFGYYNTSSDSLTLMRAAATDVN